MLPTVLDDTLASHLTELAMPGLDFQMPVLCAGHLTMVLGAFPTLCHGCQP